MSQATASEPTASAGVVELHGRRMAFEVSGTGGPTVILETGLGAESEEWALVQAEAARFACVFRYDRAGRGASDPAAGPRSALAMMEELRELLRLVGVTGPYILVGHSYGGLLMRLFAHRHPQEAAGLVLVDSMHEDQFETFAPHFPPASTGEPPELASMREFWTSGWRDPASTVERIDLVESRRQSHGVATLGDLPMRVLIAGSYRTAPMVPPAARAHLQGLWNGLQSRLAALSTRAQVIRLDASGHFIQRDDPQAIVEAIRSVFEEVRTGSGGARNRKMVTGT